MKNILINSILIAAAVTGMTAQANAAPSFTPHKSSQVQQQKLSAKADYKHKQVQHKASPHKSESHKAAQKKKPTHAADYKVKAQHAHKHSDKKISNHRS